MKKVYEEPTVSVYTIYGAEVMLMKSKDENEDEHDNGHNNWDDFE